MSGSGTSGPGGWLPMTADDLAMTDLLPGLRFDWLVVPADEARLLPAAEASGRGARTGAHAQPA